jgi:hypothetical protein
MHERPDQLAVHWGKDIKNIRIVTLVNGAFEMARVMDDISEEVLAFRVLDHAKMMFG